MTKPMPPEDRLTVDEAPIRSWIAHVPKIWEKRLIRHALTGESLDSHGVSLAEKVVAMSYRARLPYRNDSKQDEKLFHLLSTCTDPRSNASVWLRALLPVVSRALPATEQINLLAGALQEKLAQVSPGEQLKWAMIAMRSCDALCESQKFEEGQLDACVRLLSAAWQAMPNNLMHEGALTLPIREPSGFSKKPWEAFQVHVISIMRNLPRSEPTPHSLLPLQLWMAPEYEGLSLVDQETAKHHMGMVPDSMYGHRSFMNALEAGEPWPNDPRVALMVAWFEDKNPYLFPRLQAVTQSSQLARETPEIETARARTRL